ncbi:flagellar basal-body rod protein FlgG [Solimonas sp. SE-A11]|uniref:flagellar basal-body rod protein FlgG n=1 Tax=Solimonas sp. SE-A11 TaxID=3054954 RepID=UPI00259CD15B|nr:flagellar basal-body rod protein FlgG [Solimonas sp. SE-A11]MDM4772905.1 flagellar basal-body rod protein FlgG [Solimonas sp. SE-A11]
MLDAIYASISGLQAHQLRLDALSNNLANVNTPGFKKARVNFADLMYRPVEAAAADSEAADKPRQVGLGTAVASTEAIFSQGDLRQTQRPLDMAIFGQGFMEVQLADGSFAYTRLGSLRLNETGELVTTDGLRVSGDVRVPAEATQLVIDQDGRILATLPGEKDPEEIGQLELVGFVNATGLKSMGSGLYAATSESGDPFYGKPGEVGLGKLRQGFLEMSNVDFIEELSELVVAQRAYQLNARALQAADEVLAEINSLRR